MLWQTSTCVVVASYIRLALSTRQKSGGPGRLIPWTGGWSTSILSVKSIMDPRGTPARIVRCEFPYTKKISRGQDIIEGR